MSEEVLWLGFATVGLLLQGCLCQQRLRGSYSVKTLRHSPTVTQLFDASARIPEVFVAGQEANWKTHTPTPKRPCKGYGAVRVVYSILNWKSTAIKVT